MLHTNEDRIVEFLLQCQPGPPRTRGRWGVDHQGIPYLLPSIGGISVNVAAGDPAFGWAGDHVEPGVSLTANSAKPFEHPNPSLQIFACAGNTARIISGEAKGSVGYVLGHHGGSEHVIAEFPRAVKERLSYDDKIIIHGKGQGLKLLDHAEVVLFNLDPTLLSRMRITVSEDGNLRIPVTTKVPPTCMGSGLGASNTASGDYDIMTSDPETVEAFGLDKIRFGDFVALMDHDNRFGRAYRKGAMTVGIVVHSDCRTAGHGPGVTTLLTCATATIEPVIDPEANITTLIGDCVQERFTETTPE